MIYKLLFSKWNGGREPLVMFPRNHQQLKMQVNPFSSFLLLCLLCEGNLQPQRENFRALTFMLIRDVPWSKIQFAFAHSRNCQRSCGLVSKSTHDVSPGLAINASLLNIPLHLLANIERRGKERIIYLLVSIVSYKEMGWRTKWRKAMAALIMNSWLSLPPWILSWLNWCHRSFHQCQHRWKSRVCSFSFYGSIDSHLAHEIVHQCYE